MPEGNKPILDMSGDEYENVPPVDTVEDNTEAEAASAPYVPNHSAPVEESGTGEEVTAADPSVNPPPVDPDVDPDPGTIMSSGFAAALFGGCSVLFVIGKGLKVMDSTAVTLCMDNDLPIIVFKFDEPGRLARVVCGEPIGTLVNDASA